jgi:hypothetical protein
MYCAIKSLFHKIADLARGFIRNKDAMKNEDPFEPTEAFPHRYASEDVLIKMLESFRFEKGTFTIKSTNQHGLRVQLPDGKKLTREQKQKVIDEFEEEHRRRMRAEKDAAASKA